MKRGLSEEELLLEVGIALLGLLLLGGLVAVLLGRAAGTAGERWRHAKGPPESGSVPSYRHQSIGTVSTR